MGSIKRMIMHQYVLAEEEQLIFGNCVVSISKTYYTTSFSDENTTCSSVKMEPAAMLSPENKAITGLSCSFNTSPGSGTAVRCSCDICRMMLSVLIVFMTFVFMVTTIKLCKSNTRRGLVRQTGKNCRQGGLNSWSKSLLLLLW